MAISSGGGVGLTVGVGVGCERAGATVGTTAASATAASALVANERNDIGSRNRFTALEGFEFDQDGEGFDLRTEALDQA